MSTEDQRIHVVAGALLDRAGRVLLSKRPDHAHQGGLWEFPGGKVETGESRLDALGRELGEELGISVQSARPLIRIAHSYHDLTVDLDLWLVSQWRGMPSGLEGQPLKWVAPPELRDVAMPAADRPLIRALELPEHYAITPPDLKARGVGQLLDKARHQGIRMLQLRLAGSSAERNERLAWRLLPGCRRAGIRLLINGDPVLAKRVGADGVHLKSAQLSQLRSRPVSDDQLLGASCHTLEELERAAAVGADFAVLGPVRPTASHPGASVMGQDTFRSWVSEARIPVYAIGGMRPADVHHVREWGGHGVAGITGFWDQQ